MKAVGENVIVRSVESALKGGPAEVVACPNCGSERVERYCPSCGQRAGSLHTPVSEFVRDALDGLFSFDSRVWRSLIPLFRHPGSLTVHYWEGRRARFVAPLRLYLFVSFFTFLFLAVAAPEGIIDATGTNPEAMVAFGITPDDDGDSGWLSERVLRPAAENPERTQALFVQRLPWVVFALVPVFAAWLRLLYRRRERFFVPHLVFAFHFHTAAFLLYAFGTAGGKMLRTEVVSDLTSLAILTVLFLALRRVYREGRLKTIGKQAALLLVHLLAVGGSLFLLLVITGLSI